LINAITYRKSTASAENFSSGRGDIYKKFKIKIKFFVFNDDFV